MNGQLIFGLSASTPIALTTFRFIDIYIYAMHRYRINALYYDSYL